MKCDFQSHAVNKTILFVLTDRSKVWAQRLPRQCTILLYT